MTAQVEKPAISHTVKGHGALDAAFEGTTYVLRPTAEQAREAIAFVPLWLNQVREAGGRHVVIDMSQVDRLDLSGFGVLLAKLRDVLRVTSRLTGISISEIVSLRSIGLLDGADVELCSRSSRRRRRTTPHGS